MNPFLLAILQLIMPPLTRFIAWLIPARDSNLVWQETCNKLEIMQWVTKTNTLIPQTDVWQPLSDIVEKAYQLGDFPALWVIEGVGHRYTQHTLQQDLPIKNLLSPSEHTGNLPDKSLTMLHAGMGMAFAQAGFKQTDLTNKASLDKFIHAFLANCKENAHQGYLGCALEALGLVTRFEHGRSAVNALDEQLQRIAPEVRPYLWHGAGRATYFSPLNFIPGNKAPIRAVRMCLEEAPHEMGQSNMLAGLGWAINLVNMKHPEITQSLLFYHRNEPHRLEAFANGVASSIVLREDITPNFATNFAYAESQLANEELAILWQTFVQTPSQQAIEVYQPKLAKEQQLEKVFCIQNLQELSNS